MTDRRARPVHGRAYPPKSPLTADDMYARFRRLATTGIEPLLILRSGCTAEGDQFV